MLESVHTFNLLPPSLINIVCHMNLSALQDTETELS